MDKPILRDLTLGQILDETVAQYPDNEAVVYVDRDYRMTYREFGTLVDNLAKGFMAMGVARGRRSPFGPPTCPIGWRCNCPAKIGAILLTSEHALQRAELEYLLKDSE